MKNIFIVSNRMYAKIYQAKINACSTQKINVYNHSLFKPLPQNVPPIAPSLTIYKPIQPCGQPYQTPTYHPPYCGCKTCTCSKN